MALLCAGRRRCPCVGGQGVLPAQAFARLRPALASDALDLAVRTLHLRRLPCALVLAEPQGGAQAPLARHEPAGPRAPDLHLRGRHCAMLGLRVQRGTSAALGDTLWFRGAGPRRALSGAEAAVGTGPRLCRALAVFAADGGVGGLLGQCPLHLSAGLGSSERGVAGGACGVLLVALAGCGPDDQGQLGLHRRQLPNLAAPARALHAAGANKRWPCPLAQRSSGRCTASVTARNAAACTTTNLLHPLGRSKLFAIAVQAS
mmetsp:Transcript_30059/g.69923  ORF Transcript_30059/g.69923 Transcript_30059/m.69923 type:complete len:260 (+) Transcript_30059:406-1185(+)